MKLLALTILLSLFSSTNVFAKGGEFPPIDHDDLDRMLKKARQIKVSLKQINNRDDFVDSKFRFSLLLGGLEAERYLSLVKEKSEREKITYCIEVSNILDKETVTRRIKTLLRDHTFRVDTSIDTSLKKLCH